jgi:hypothetical protein
MKNKKTTNIIIRQFNFELMDFPVSSLQLIVFCDDTATCSDQGTCGIDGICQCVEGKQGANCSEDKPPPSPNGKCLPCTGHHCLSMHTNFSIFDNMFEFQPFSSNLYLKNQFTPFLQ